MGRFEYLLILNMKLFYFILSLCCVYNKFSAQDAFWTITNYKGAFPVTDNTAATDWTSGWSNFDAENTIYPTTLTTASTDITVNTTWSGVVLLQNKVYVKNNATLTIAPGTIIRGDKATQATLIITRGAKINAQGTVSQPIIFTSNEPIGNRAEGDWGGIVLLGLARNNQPGGVANIEGIVPTTDTQFGGAFDNDNSGVMKYVRIEFPGIPLEPNKELNGLTFGSVGSATTVDYVQVSHSGDDSFEWFGGTVNCKHIIAYRGLDDDFDTDYGYRGKVQFALSIRDKDLSDAPGDSNGFESDNDAAGSAGQPKTRPVFSNVTLVGAKGNGTVTLPIGEKFEKAFRLRRNTAISVLNSLVTGWEKGLAIEGAAVVNNLNGDTLVFANNILTNFATPSWSTGNTNTQVASPATTAWYQSWWSVDGNDSTKTLAEVNWVNIFTPLGTTPDARLASGSVAATGATFTNPIFFSVAAPTAVTSVSYCQNATATALPVTASSGNTLKWYNVATGGSALSSAPVPNTTAPGTYTYYVSQSNSNNDESVRVAINVIVNALPSTPIISASGSTSFCTGGSVVLSSSAATGNIWSNGATTQTITATTSGTYSVIVIDNNGCTASSVGTTLNLSNAPAPTVYASATQACSGETVTLTSSTADSYTWSNGATTQFIQVTATGTFSVVTTNADSCMGVGTSNTVNVTFTAASNDILTISMCAPYISPINQTYLQSGTYNEVIPNINGCDSVNLTINLTIQNSASSISAIICIGDSYTWNGQQYTQPGQYTQTFTNQFGCDSVVTLTLNVNTNDNISITPNPAFGNAPLNVAFANQTPNLSNYNFTWYFGDGTSQQSNAPFMSHIYTQNGYADVTVVADNLTTGCSSSQTFNDLIFVIGGVTCTHTATINQTGPLTGCVGDSILLSSNTDPSFTYQWNKNGIPVSGATTSSFYPTQSGSYTVTIYQNNCPVTSAGISVTFNPLPSVPTISSSGTITPCSGGSITLTAPSGLTSYLWNTGSTASSLVVSQSGNYSVTVTNSNGCSQTSNPFAVNASFMAAPQVCIVGVDSLTNENRVVWEKPLTLGIDSFYVYKETNVSNVYTKIGATDYNQLAIFLDVNSNPAVQAYRYKISALDTCGVETNVGDFHKTIHLTINQGIGGAWNLIWSHYEGLNFGSYNIYRGTDPSNISLLTTIQSNLNSYTDLSPPTGPLYYQIEVVNPVNCDPTKIVNYGVSRSNIVNNGVSGVIEISNTNILVYPNPTNSNITLEVSSELVGRRYSIRDFSGRIIRDGKITSTQEQIDLQHVARGAYYLSIENSSAVTKLIKQ